MTSKFETEKAKVVLLMQRLGRMIEAYENPNCARGAAGESGADVIAISSGHRIGVQVTDLDTGARLGKARAEEMKLAREAQAHASTYFVLGQNDPSKLVEAIARCVARKSQMSFSGFDEFWLLICAGLPTSGAVGFNLRHDSLDSVEHARRRDFTRPRKLEVLACVHSLHFGS